MQRAKWLSCISLLLILLLTGCAGRQLISSPIRASQELLPGYKSVLIVGCRGPEIGEFDHPTGITLDKKGNLYVTDTGNRRIQGFNPKGQPITAFGGIEDGLGMLTGITSFKRGLLVVDRSRNLLLAFTPKGQPLKIDFSQEISQFRDLNQVAQCKKGRIFGVEGDRAIAIDKDNNFLYIADFNKIQKFRINKDGSLELVLEFGGWGEAHGKFNLPQGIDVDRQGNIYVADTLNNRIQKFSPRGKFLLSLEGLNKPMGIAVTEIGEIWVVENGSHRLQKFVPEIEVVIPKEIAAEKNYEWVYNCGRKFQSSGKFYHAIAYYKRCIEIRPDSALAPKAQLQIARCFRKIGSNEAAFMAYEKVVEDYPRSREAPMALFEKGRLLEELGLFEDARKTYERLVKLYPDSKEGRRAEGRIEFIEEEIFGG